MPYDTPYINTYIHTYNINTYLGHMAGKDERGREPLRRRKEPEPGWMRKFRRFPENDDKDKESEGDYVPKTPTFLKPTTPGGGAASDNSDRASSQDSSDDRTGSEEFSPIVGSDRWIEWKSARAEQLEIARKVAQEQVKKTSTERTPQYAVKGGHRPCPQGCGYLMTWSDEFCCHTCGKGKGMHGPKCDKISTPPGEQDPREGCTSTEEEAQSPTEGPRLPQALAVKEEGFRHKPPGYHECKRHACIMCRMPTPIDAARAYTNKELKEGLQKQGVDVTYIQPVGGKVGLLRTSVEFEDGLTVLYLRISHHVGPPIPKGLPYAGTVPVCSRLNITSGDNIERGPFAEHLRIWLTRYIPVNYQDRCPSYASMEYEGEACRSLSPSGEPTMRPAEGSQGQAVVKKESASSSSGTNAQPIMVRSRSRSAHMSWTLKTREECGRSTVQLRATGSSAAEPQAAEPRPKYAAKRPADRMAQGPKTVNDDKKIKTDDPRAELTRDERIRQLEKAARQIQREWEREGKDRDDSEKRRDEEARRKEKKEGGPRPAWSRRPFALDNALDNEDYKVMGQGRGIAARSGEGLRHPAGIQHALERGDPGSGERRDRRGPQGAL